MEQRWGLPLIAWPSRLRPNYWDLVALPMVLGVIALIAWGGLAIPGLAPLVDYGWFVGAFGAAGAYLIANKWFAPRPHIEVVPG